MMGHKICIYGEIWLITPKLSLLPLLIWSTENALKLCFVMYRIALFFKISILYAYSVYRHNVWKKILTQKGPSVLVLWCMQ